MPRKLPTKKSSPSTCRSGRTPAHKTRQEASYTEKDVERAIEACHPSNPSRISPEAAEMIFHVPASTIRQRMRGRTASKDAHVKQQHLTPAQERILAMYCRRRGWRAEPVDVDELRALVKRICNADVGVNWHLSFAKRHKDIKFRWAKRGEAKRASGLNQYNVDSFYKELKVALEDVEVENIWNCDEKGFQANGGVLRRRVICASEQKEPKIMGDESRKMVTILECVNPKGDSVSPLLIHEGAEKDGDWVRRNPCGAQ
jgi:hypothetical protein